MPVDTPPPVPHNHDTHIAENACMLLAAMPITSPLRRNLIDWLSCGMTTREAAGALGISCTTVWRSRHDDLDWLTTMTARPGLHRNRIECEDHAFLMDLVDELIPYASGRLYREQTMITRKFYKIYMQRCDKAGQIPLSLSFISTQGTLFAATVMQSLTMLQC